MVKRFLGQTTPIDHVIRNPIVLNLPKSFHILISGMLKFNVMTINYYIISETIYFRSTPQQNVKC